MLRSPIPLLSLLILALLFVAPLTAGEDGGTDLFLVRAPSLSPDGSTIAFCSMGDIWTVPARAVSPCTTRTTAARSGLPTERGSPSSRTGTVMTTSS